MIEKTTSEDAPKIEFPCENYPIKIMGSAGEVFKQEALKVIKLHAADFSGKNMHINMSKNGNYQAITVAICAQSEQQLKDIFEDLKKIDGIQIVL